MNDNDKNEINNKEDNNIKNNKETRNIKDKIENIYEIKDNIELKINKVGFENEEYLAPKVEKSKNEMESLTNELSKCFGETKKKRVILILIMILIKFS